MMCLDRVYVGNEKKDALAKLPESGYHWKTVSQHHDGNYHPICFSLPNKESFKAGWNQTKGKYIHYGYIIAFHLNRDKKGAESWQGKTIRCIVKKKDIVAIGRQFGGLVIVTKRFWMPKPKKKPVNRYS